MKKNVIPIIAIVLLVNVNKTFAQTGQTTSGPGKSAISNTTAPAPTGTVKNTDGNKMPPVALNRPAGAIMAAPAVAPQPLPHKPQMNIEQIEEHETAMAREMGNAYSLRFSLSVKQHEAVNVACLNYVQAVDERRTGKRVTSQMDARYMAEFNSKLQSILTAEQNGKLQASKSAMGFASTKR